MKLSILIPCFNEERTIKVLLDKVIENLNQNDEIIIIDDFSTDKTRNILRNQFENSVYKIIYNEKNYGKGFSIRQGIKAATGEIILIQDADLEYDPSDYKKLTDPIKNNIADVVYGSRFIGSQERRVLFFWHTLGNKFLTLLSNIVTNLNLTDMEVGYKAFRSEVLKNVKMATYEVNMKRILKKEGTTVGLANGVLSADGKIIYRAENLKVGLFKS